MTRDQKETIKAVLALIALVLCSGFAEALCRM